LFRPEQRDFNYYFCSEKDVNTDSGKQRGLLKRKGCNCRAPPSPSDLPLSPVWRGPADPVGLSLATGCRLSPGSPPAGRGRIQPAPTRVRASVSPAHSRQGIAFIRAGKRRRTLGFWPDHLRDVRSLQSRASALGGFSLGRSFGS